MRHAPLLLPALAAALAAASAAAPPPPRPGLWIGPIRACRSTVAEVVVAASDIDGRPSATIRFREGWAETLRRETAALVGEAMPVRLDGRIVLEPRVWEPITGGVIQISPIPADEVEAIRAAALAAC